MIHEIVTEHRLLQAKGQTCDKRFCAMCGLITEGKNIVAILNPNMDDDSVWLVCKSCAEFIAETQRTVIKELIARAKEKVIGDLASKPGLSKRKKGVE